MKRHFVSVMLAQLLMATVGHGAYDLNQVLGELANREKTMNILQFDFTQEINFTEMKNKTTVVGEAIFGKAGKLRITKQLPVKQVTVSDGKKVWVYNPTASQVWLGSSKKWLESSSLPKGMIPFNNYVADLQKNFNLVLDQEKKNVEDEIQIVAEPKNKTLGYKMRLTVSTHSWLPVKMVYLSDSAEVETLLSKHQVNPSIQDSVFRFTVPKGTDVIPFN